MLKENPVLMVRLESRVLKVPRENKALLEKLVTAVHLEIRDLLENQEIRVLQELQEIVELQESLVNLVVEVPRVLMEVKEPKARRGRNLSWTRKEILVILEHLELQVKFDFDTIFAVDL